MKRALILVAVTLAGISPALAQQRYPVSSEAWRRLISKVEQAGGKFSRNCYAERGGYCTSALVLMKSNGESVRFMVVQPVKGVTVRLVCKFNSFLDQRNCTDMETGEDYFEILDAPTNKWVRQ